MVGKYIDSDYNFETNSSQVQNLEGQLKQAEEAIKLRDQAKRLVNNRDFKAIIEKRFCEVECSRYAQASADPNLSDREQAYALSLAQAAGHLRRYIQVIFLRAQKAEEDMEALRLNIEEARYEETFSDQSEQDESEDY